MAVAEVDGFPTLVLLPGLDGTGQLFDRFREVLGPDLSIQVIRYPESGPQDADTLATWVRKHLPTAPFVLVAESFSGPVAIRLASEPPPGLAGMVLCATFASNPRPRLAWMRSFLPILPLFPALAPALGPWLFGRYGSRSLRQQVQNALTLVSSQTLKARLKQVLTQDVSGLCRRVAVPVLDLRAQEDRLVPARARRGLEDLPQLTQASIPGPHLLLQTKPQGAVDVILGFMEAQGFPLPKRTPDTATNPGPATRSPV